MSSLAEQFNDFVVNWPDIDFAQITLLVCASLQVVIAWVVLRQSYVTGKSNEGDVIKELRGILTVQVDREEWSLIRPERVQALTITLREAYSSPAITDRTIAALARTLSLEYKKRGPPNLRMILRALDKISSHFDGSTPRYMSIGATNRMLAYYVSGLAFSFLTFGCQLWTYNAGWLWIAWLLSVGHAWVAFAAIRARNFWNHRYTAAGGPLCPSKPHRWVDMSLYFAVDTSGRIHTSFAPLFEEIMFRVVPVLVLPGMLGFSFALARALFDYAPSPDVMQRTFYAVAGIIIYWQVWVFSSWHNYKYSEFRSLKKELLRVEKEFVVGRSTRGKLSKSRLEKVAQISERMWVLTGDDYWHPDQVLERLLEMG